MKENKIKVIKFIFFLTSNDVTIPNAIEVFEEIKDTNIRYVGFKDIGLTRQELENLREQIRKTNKLAFLEVVSTTKVDNLHAAKICKELQVDYLIGGIYVEEVLEVLKGTETRFFPYIGKIVGHPCLQRGAIEEICEDARRVEKIGVDGIDLLAYRYNGDAVELTKAVRDAVNLPIIVAGSITTFEQIQILKELRVWAFTIGTAVLEKKFIPTGTVRDQIEAVMDVTKL